LFRVEHGANLSQVKIVTPQPGQLCHGTNLESPAKKISNMAIVPIIPLKKTALRPLCDLKESLSIRRATKAKDLYVPDELV
jgi:hypothetical protein